MIQYFSRKLFLMGAVLFIVISVTFFISHMLPGDPLLLWAGERPTEEQLDLARENLGLDQPKTKQFYIFLRNIIRGDMGISLRTRQPVIKEIGVRFASTLELVSFSMFFALFVGALLGLVSVLKKGTKIDSFIRVAGYVGMSFPVFWLGMVLQIVFFGLLGWLPLQGRLSGQFLPELNTGFVFIDCLFSGQWDLLIDATRHAALPVLTMTIGITGVVIRTSRSALISTMSEPYFLTYRSFGFSTYETIKKSGYKNTLLPVSTIMGLVYGMMLGGTFFIESIFDWPGMGQFGVLSVLTGDFPSVIGVTIVYSVSYILINFFVDLLYFIIDPRTRI